MCNTYCNKILHNNTDKYLIQNIDHNNSIFSLNKKSYSSQYYSNGKITYRGGVKWTIKGGVVYDNKKLIEEVLRVVRESKENWADPVPPLFNPKN